MWNYECNETEAMNLRDSMEGVVREQNRFGLYIDLKIDSDLIDETEHMIPVFGYWTGRVPKGTKVFCSIKRWAKENKNILVNVDSVVYESDMERAA
mgnify:CR=1 FL=1